MTPFLALGPVQINTIVSIVLMTLLFTIIALVDILRSRFKETNDKLIWVLIVLFLGIFGVLLYLIIGRSRRVSNPKRKAMYALHYSLNLFLYNVTDG